MIPGVSRTWRNNSESHGEKVTLLSSFSYLFFFFLPVEVASYGTLPSRQVFFFIFPTTVFSFSPNKAGHDNNQHLLNAVLRIL